MAEEPNRELPRAVRTRCTVHVFKPTTSDVLPNTKYEVTGMARALIRQVTNFHTASRKLDEMEPVNGDSDSEGHLKVRMQRDRALLQIQRFSWNFKQGNFVDFNPEVSALSSAKAVSANANKRKLNCISPPGISGLQAGSQLIRIQQPVAIDLQAHQVQQQQAQQQLQMQQMQHSPCTPHFGSRGGVSGSTSFWPAPGVFEKFFGF